MCYGVRIVGSYGSLPKAHSLPPLPSLSSRPSPLSPLPLSLSLPPLPPSLRPPSRRGRGWPDRLWSVSVNTDNLHTCQYGIHPTTAPQGIGQLLLLLKHYGSEDRGEEKNLESTSILLLAVLQG